MKTLRSLVMAFSMFSKIPMPRIKWDSGNMRSTLAVFPFIGIVVGLVLRLWLWLCTELSLNMIICAAGMTLLPVAITGGIHLDGFCDTCDALASHSSPERSREILKDSHTGAFALIGLGAYLLAFFAFCTAIPVSGRKIWLISIIPLMSRSCSALASLLFPSGAKEGLLYTFRSASGGASVIAAALWFFLSAAALIFTGGLTGLLMSLAALIVVVYIYFLSRERFGGMSGDIAGYLLQLCELTMLIVMIITEKAVNI